MSPLNINWQVNLTPLPPPPLSAILTPNKLQTRQGAAPNEHPRLHQPWLIQLPPTSRVKSYPFAPLAPFGIAVNFPVALFRKPGMITLLVKLLRLTGYDFSRQIVDAAGYPPID